MARMAGKKSDAHPSILTPIGHVLGVDAKHEGEHFVLVFLEQQ